MIGFIYIHPKSADIKKNELHKKIIFRDTVALQSHDHLLNTHVFDFALSVAGLSGEPLCGLHTPGSALNPGPLPFCTPDLRQGSPGSGCRGEYSPSHQCSLRSSSLDVFPLGCRVSYLGWD